jgi:flagellar hook assembly protein FlgD
MYTIPQRDGVRVSVFDVQGRLVAKLAEGSQPAGHHRVRWSGQGTYGNLLPAGVYFVRLESAGYIEAQKIVITR